MSKHIIDRPRARTYQRLSRFAPLDMRRRVKRGPQAVLLHRRPAQMSDWLRMRRFLNLARQAT